MERHAVFTAVGFRFECMPFELHMHSIRILEDADKIREALNNSDFVVILRCIGRGICATAKFSPNTGAQSRSMSIDESPA